MQYRNGARSWGVWVVPAIIALVAIWVGVLLLRQPAAVAPAPGPAKRLAPATAVALPRVQPTATAMPRSAYGKNLLVNPSFKNGSKGWTEFHNAQPMTIRYDAKAGMVTIAPGDARNSVEEISQTGAFPEGTARIDGIVRITGAPLPPSWSARVIAIDVAGQSHPVYALTSLDGQIGPHPFTTAIETDRGLKQLVLAVITGSATDARTKIGFSDLSLAVRAR